MKPGEFFELTPFEVEDWIGPALEGQFGLAWRLEAVHRQKRLPDRPDKLWQRAKRFMTPDEMLKTMQGLVEVFKSKKDEAPRPKPKVSTPKKYKGISMRDAVRMEKQKGQSNG